MTIDRYRSLAAPCIAEYKDKNSRFIAYAEAVRNSDEVRNFLGRVQVEHPKATHHCYAYRLGFDKQANYRANDDGEPAGSAGRPILGQIDAKNLSNVMVIVVRYFGGTKLGVPGLISAYKGVSAEVLSKATIVELAVRHQYRLQFDYLQMNDVMKIVKREAAAVSHQNFADTCTLELFIDKANSARLLERLQAIDELQVLYLGLE